MVEEIYAMTFDDDKKVERVIQDENIHYIHMVFGNGEGLPEHYANSVVYMSVVRGMLSIDLDDQGVHCYPASTVLKIPFHTKMNVRNSDEQTLELIVVKAPAPKN